MVSRLQHFAAYFTGQIFDIRATCWTMGSLILIFMTVWTLLARSAPDMPRRQNCCPHRRSEKTQTFQWCG